MFENADVSDFVFLMQYSREDREVGGGGERRSAQVALSAGCVAAVAVSSSWAAVLLSKTAIRALPRTIVLLPQYPTIVSTAATTSITYQ